MKRAALFLTLASTIFISAPVRAGFTLHESATLTAIDGVTFSRAGSTTAIDNNIAVMGASQTPGAFPNTGAAFVFERNNGTWSQAAALQPGDTAPKYFGWDVAVSGNTVIVGAIDDQSSTAKGAAYIFERQPNGTWSQTAKLLASNGAAVDRFGFSVAISGSLAIVGANRGDTSVANSGAAYVFQKNNGAWSQVAVLASPNPGANRLFGESVALSGNTAVIGAANTPYQFLSEYGAAYVFQRNTTSGAWSLAQSLILPWDGGGTGTEHFGEDVTISGDTIAVASPGEYGEGKNGAVTIFERNLGGAGNWGSAGIYRRPAPGTPFGGDFLDNGTIAIDGDYAVFGGFIYERNPAAIGGWTNTGQLLPLNPTIAWEGGLRYSESVAISNGTILSGSGLLDGAQVDAGGMFVFVIPEPTSIAILAAGTVCLLTRRRR